MGSFLDDSKDVQVIPLIVLDFPDSRSLLSRRYIGDISTKIVFFFYSEERDSLFTPSDMEYAKRLVGWMAEPRFCLWLRRCISPAVVCAPYVC